MRKRHPARLAWPSSCATTGASRAALPCTSARSTAGSVRLTLSYSAVSDTGSRSILRAAACSDGRSPSETSIINSTTLDIINSRGYCRRRLASNTSSIQPAGSACSSATRAITPTGACCSNRSSTSAHILLLLCYRTRLQAKQHHLERDASNRPLKNAPLMPAWTPLAFFFRQSDDAIRLQPRPSRSPRPLSGLISRLSASCGRTAPRASAHA